MKSLSRFLVLAFCLLSVITLNAQEAPDITLESPYNTMLVHLYYLQPDSEDRAKAAQTIYGIADSIKAEKLAVRLKQILDGKGLYVRLNQLPQENDYTDSTTQKHYYTPFPQDLPEVYLERIDGKWYYSKETIANIPALHKSVYPLGSDLLINAFPGFGQKTFLGLRLWQYLGALILLLLVFLLHLFLSRLLNPLVERLSQSKLYPSLISRKLTFRIARYLSILLLLQLLKILLPLLQLPIEAANVVMVILKVFTSVMVILVGLRILDIILLYAGRVTEGTNSKMDDQLLPILKRTLQVIVVVLGIVHVLRLLDVNITALIAGISIGGLALALAAQDTVKNLIGSAMIFVDRPFQIGDWIEGSGFAGTVLEVGFRTTRIQMVDSSIISVPNGTIANLAITNLGVRVFRLYNTTVGLTYDATPDKIEEYMEGLKRMVIAHPKLSNEGYYVRFKELADSSLNIMFRARIETNDYNEELKIKEEINLGLMRLASAVGVSFAFPSTSVYVETMAAPKPKNEKSSNDTSSLDDFIKDFEKRVS